MVQDHDSGVAVREIKVPPLVHNAALVRVEAATGCGTDVHIAAGHMRHATTCRVPLVLGHEMVGRVVALGRGRTTDALNRPVAEGDLIAWASPWCGSCYHATGAHYLNADTTAFMQFLQGDLFADFPDLRFVIPHGGGAVPYHWGRYRGLADMLGKRPLAEHVMRNVHFDTCVYHQPGIDLLFRVIDPKNILFGSEMVGAVRGVDPETSHYFDDTKRYLDALDVSDAVKAQVFEGNARRVYPRLDASLRARQQ